MIRLLLAVTVISLPLRAAWAQASAPSARVLPPDALAGLVDRAFARRSLTTGPGCAVGVAQGGVTRFERGYGMADLEGGRAIDAQTIFESGSVAKQFTATAIVLLALEGKLSLDDDVRRHVPELPTYDAPITIRHLLNHTSGLREWSSLVALAGWPRGSRVHRQEDLLAIITAQRALNYPVGQTYSYTNSGFALLPTIVERVSGQTFAAFSQARIFGPLGMTHTRWRDDFTAVVPRRALAYARAADGWHLDMPFENVHGPGGLLTTVGDFLRWNAALDAKLFGVAWADTLVHRSRTTSGREIRYGLGITNDRYRGAREWSHSGATGGYRTFLARYPELGQLSIAILCNAADADPTAIAHALVDSLGRGLSPVPALDTVAADPAALAAWSGVWRQQGPNTAAPAELVGGRLRLGGGIVTAAPGGAWRLGTRPLQVLARDEAGRPMRAAIIGVEQDTVLLERMAPADTAGQALDALVGRYRSDEVGATYAVRRTARGLELELRTGVVSPLRPVYRDGFEAETLGADVFFTRDRRGRVTALHVGGSRAWDVVFARLP